MSSRRSRKRKRKREARAKVRAARAERRAVKDAIWRLEELLVPYAIEAGGRWAHGKGRLRGHIANFIVVDDALGLDSLEGRDASASAHGVGEQAELDVVGAGSDESTTAVRATAWSWLLGP